MDNVRPFVLSADNRSAENNPVDFNLRKSFEGTGDEVCAKAVRNDGNRYASSIAVDRRVLFSEPFDLSLACRWPEQGNRAKTTEIQRIVVEARGIEFAGQFFLPNAARPNTVD